MIFLFRAATGFPLIVPQPKNNKTKAGKVASVGRSFPAGFVSFPAAAAIRFNPCRKKPPHKNQPIIQWYNYSMIQLFNDTIIQ